MMVVDQENFWFIQFDALSLWVGRLKNVADAAKMLSHSNGANALVRKMKYF